MDRNQKLEFIKKSLDDYLGNSEEVVYIFKEFQAQKVFTRSLTQEIYAAGFGLCLQGKEDIHFNGELIEHSANKLSGAFVPVPVTINTYGSKNEPCIGIGLISDEERLAKILLKISSVKEIEEPKEENLEVTFCHDVTEEFIDVVYRFIKLLDKPEELEILGDNLLDEMYFRVLYNTEGELYKHLLYKKGQFQQVSKSIDYINSNLDEIISVDDLAASVNMSVSSYHKKFKGVMNMSPLQYIKSMKLDKAQNYLQQGKNVSQTADLVGYNSLAQFSREYKRHFGILPSQI